MQESETKKIKVWHPNCPPIYFKKIKDGDVLNWSRIWCRLSWNSQYGSKYNYSDYFRYHIMRRPRTPGTRRVHATLEVPFWNNSSSSSEIEKGAMAMGNCKGYRLSRISLVFSSKT